ncbi:ATP-binding protein [Actinomycetospora flava]|uniref:ATP-binding protein n=1 Tax=Actinomycetospora flava TaxID=3129232 RepID=A0ABU8M5K5_9PSEU
MSTVEFRLGVGEARVRQFEQRRPASAVIELVWNALDANATNVIVEVHRTAADAPERITVTDDGQGMSPQQARQSFEDFGETWKATRSYTEGNLRVLHGENGEGRLFAFALGYEVVWETVVEEDDGRRLTQVRGNVTRPTRWTIEDVGETDRAVGTTVTAYVPQGRGIGTLENAEATVAYLLPRFASYLYAYPEVNVSFEGTRLDASSLLTDVVELPLEVEEYKGDTPPPIVHLAEWSTRVYDKNQGMYLSDMTGRTKGFYEQKWGESVVHFTPFLRSLRFTDLDSSSIHELPMRHARLLDGAEQAIRRHLSERRDQISSRVVEQLKDEGLYPYAAEADGLADQIERQTFDVVVTVARSALPKKPEERRLSVQLIRSALEQNPSHLQDLLRQVLTLSPAEEQHLVRLLEETELSNVIAAATTVTDRLKFVGGLRKILADPELRRDFREVDQLHPLIARNLWIFGEEWTLARTEVGLTGVLKSHLGLLGGETELEVDLEAVRRDDGRSGRVDVLLFRGRGDEEFTERLVVELKRPTVTVGRDELEQIKSYARAIVDDPQYSGTKCRWQFILVTYNYDHRIHRDINERERPRGLADDQEEYQVWVKTWGELFDTAERKLKFFRDQLEYEATDDRVTRHLQESYNSFIPERLRVDVESGEEIESGVASVDGGGS